MVNETKWEYTDIRFAIVDDNGIKVKSHMRKLWTIDGKNGSLSDIEAIKDEVERVVLTMY